MGKNPSVGFCYWDGIRFGAAVFLVHEVFPSALKALNTGPYREEETVLDLTGLYKAALFDGDDKIVINLDNIEAVLAAEVVVERIRPLVRMLLRLEFGVKTADLFGGRFPGTEAELFEDDVAGHYESLLLVEIR